jgi:hypothetical protein
MTSQSRSRRKLSPDGTEKVDAEGGLVNEPWQSYRKPRLPTVYDTVAGKASDFSYLMSATANRLAGRVTIYHETARRMAGAPSLAEERNKSHRFSSKAIIGPDGYLFRSKGAPGRYQEYDIYQANERELPEGGRHVLPESDLLKAMHGYASQFYELTSMGEPKTQGEEQRDLESKPNLNMRSMDETALLAFGILVEEASRELLGRTGDLVFTEGEEIPAGASDAQGVQPEEHLAAPLHSPLNVGIDDGAERSQRGNRRPQKKRRVEREGTGSRMD